MSVYDKSTNNWVATPFDVAEGETVIIQSRHPSYTTRQSDLTVLAKKPDSTPVDFQTIGYGVYGVVNSGSAVGYNAIYESLTMPDDDVILYSW